MNDHSVFLPLLLFYIAVLAALGWHFRKQARTPADFCPAPFFPEVADAMARRAAPATWIDPAFDHLLDRITQRPNGRRTRIEANITLEKNLDWENTVTGLTKDFPVWVTPAGIDAALRLTHGDWRACISLCRGAHPREIWFSAEPMTVDAPEKRREIGRAMMELGHILDPGQDLGIRSDRQGPTESGKSPT
jgi:hypothetical protein